ncbi:MAG: acyltransferase family protein, partial [Methanobrevibacter sp.]|nr:acyltransferase family protein [Methanobrevibacter sp.]
SKLNEAEYFLVIWLIACLFIYTFKIDLPINLTYFVGPIGYIVLGYYLRHTERKILNNTYFDIFLILISAVSMIFFSWYFSSTETVYNFDIYTILVIGEATGVFLLFKNFYKFNLKLNFIRNPHSIVNKLIMAMAKYSYGIYLTHATIIVIFVDAIDGFGFHVNGFTISMLVIALFVPLAIMFILDKIPVINQLIGSK